MEKVLDFMNLHDLTRTWDTKWHATNEPTRKTNTQNLWTPTILGRVTRSEEAWAGGEAGNEDGQLQGDGRGIDFGRWAHR